MKLCAAQRLNTYRHFSSVEEDAAFDNTRLDELKNIARQLNRDHIPFRFSDARLVMRVSESMVHEIVRHCVAWLNRNGWGLQIDHPDILHRRTFGLRGERGLVLQRVHTTLCIFFVR